MRVSRLPAALAYKLIRRGCSPADLATLAMLWPRGGHVPQQTKAGRAIKPGVSQIVTRLRSSRSARQVRELRSSLSALGRCRREGLQSTLVVPVLDGTLVVPVLDSTAIGRAMYGDCDQSSIGLTTPAGRRCRRSFLCTVCG